MEQRKGSILAGALLLTGGNLLMRLMSIAFNVFLADQIGAAGLGLHQLISTIGVFAILVGTSGVRVASMCLAAEEFGRRKPGGVRLAISSCLRYGMGVSSLAGLALFLLARPISLRLLGQEEAILSLRLMGLFLPFVCLNGVMGGYFTACSKIRQLVVIQFAEHLFSLLLTAGLLLLWAKGDLSRSCGSIILGGSVGTLVNFALLYVLYRRDMAKITPDPEKKPMQRRLLHLCIPLALNDYLRAGLNTAEQLLIPYGLARYGGSGTQAMADYGTIHAMVFPVLMFPAAILYSVSDLLVPELSRSRAMGRKLRILDLGDKCLRLTILFSAAVAGFLFVSAPTLGQLIYGSADASHYLRIFAPMILMLYLDAITDGMLKGLAEQVSCVRYNTFTSLLDVIFLFLLLPRWGIGGYVFSFTVTHAINLILSLRRFLVVTGHRLHPSSLILPWVCAALCTAAALALPQIWLLPGIFYLFLLCAVFLLTELFREKDCRWLRRVVGQIKQGSG